MCTNAHLYFLFRARSEPLSLLVYGDAISKDATFFDLLGWFGGGARDKEELQAIVPEIHKRIVTAMKTLCDKSTSFGGVRSDAANDAKQRVSEMKGDELIDEKMADTFAQLWRDEGIQHTYKMRTEFKLFSSLKYFIDKLEKVSNRAFGSSLTVCAGVAS